jgi:hypothetical protein
MQKIWEKLSSTFTSLLGKLHYDVNYALYVPSNYTLKQSWAGLLLKHIGTRIFRCRNEKEMKGTVDTKELVNDVLSIHMSFHYEG